MKLHGVVFSLVAVAGISVWLAGRSSVAQTPADPVTAVPSAQQRSRQSQEQQEGPSLPNPDKRILEDNDKDMKKKVDRLFELATELKAEVDKTDSSKVLSLNLLKKAEEIEKLARDIKNRSKG